MGRVLKRVPLSFNYPLNQVWDGYLNPYKSDRCMNCDCSGLNAETKKISDNWYTFLRDDGEEGWGHNLEQEDVQALLDAGRLWDFTRVPINDEQREIVRQELEAGKNSWLPFDNGYIPTAEEVNIWSRKGLGHDSCNQWICVEARAKRLGVWGTCPICNGAGELWSSAELKQKHDTWKKTNPPRGRGFQLWETTSEGSPVSPVFRTLDELCAWCEPNATTFGSHKATAEAWKAMLSKDFVHHKEDNIVFI